MSILSGQDLGRELCQALDIDPATVLELSIECSVHGAATVTYKTIRHIDTRGGDRIRKVIEKFEIVRSHEPPPP